MKFLASKSLYLFVLSAKQKKNAYRSEYVVARREFYSFYVRAAIDRDSMEWTTKFPRSKTCTRFLLYLSLGGFVCGFSLLNPWVAYAGEDEETVCTCGNSGRHTEVLVENVWACEKRNLVKPRFWKRAWIFLRREVNYFKNKCGDPTILF